MEPPHSIDDLRHELANPLTSLLSEAELALLDAATMPAEVVWRLLEIERLALRMRRILRATR